jgi:formiminoglutamase
MELAKRAYLAAEAAPWTYDAGRAERLRRALQPILVELDRIARSGVLADRRNPQ